MPCFVHKYCFSGCVCPTNVCQCKAGTSLSWTSSRLFTLTIWLPINPKPPDIKLLSKWLLHPSFSRLLYLIHTHTHVLPSTSARTGSSQAPFYTFFFCLPPVVFPFVSPVSRSDVFHCLQQQHRGDEPATVTSGASVMLIPSPLS